MLIAETLAAMAPNSTAGQRAAARQQAAGQQHTSRQHSQETQFVKMGQ